MSSLRAFVLACVCFHCATAFAPPATRAAALRQPLPLRTPSPLASEKPSVEEVTEKYGLEAGLFSALKRGKEDSSDGSGEEADGGKGGLATAGDLLKRYGGAYLLTSTSLAVVSFSFCYWAVSNGVDVASLLAKVGIEVRRASLPP